jgi:hypothetical protein
MFYIFVEPKRKDMSILTLEIFTSIIESIRLQLEKDKENAYGISNLFKVDESCVPPYDNSLLIKSLVSLLQIHFPKSDGHCEIEHFMFDMNFGKMGDQELVTIENLWDRLNEPQLLDVADYQSRFGPIVSENLVSTHPLIDESGHWSKFSSVLNKGKAEIIEYAEKRLQEIRIQRDEPEFKTNDIKLTHIQGKFHAFEEIIRQFKK